MVKRYRAGELYNGSGNPAVYLASDYDALAASLTEPQAGRDKLIARDVQNNLRIQALEAALREVMAATFSQDSAHKIAERALTTPETVAQRPDEYAAHSPECYLRKYREGYCDCELPQSDRGEKR